MLLDLGLAKSINEQTFTQYPGLVGTTYYMAPEQLKGERARKAADLFAIGLTVRTAINGSHAFYDPSGSYTIDEAICAIVAVAVLHPEGGSFRARLGKTLLSS